MRSGHRSRTRRREILGWTLVIALGVQSAACSVSGERGAAPNADGGTNCPETESCSDATPLGLSFSTRDFGGLFGGPPIATARGGTQQIEVTDRRTGSALSTLFAARASSGAFSIASVTPPSVTIRGEAAGSALLRITDVASDQLLDRVALSVAEITAVDAGVSSELGLSGEIALLLGGTAYITVSLSNGGTPLVDRGATATSDSPDIVRVTSASWQSASILALAPGTAGVTVTAGGSPHRAVASIRVVEVIDGIEPASASDGFTAVDQPVPQTDGATICFLARSGGANVAGAHWLISSTLASVHVDETWFANCRSVQPTTVEPFELRVAADGQTRRYAMTVEPAR